MASARVGRGGGCALIQASSAFNWSGGIRTLSGLVPTKGRFHFFLMLDGLAIITYIRKCGSVTASNASAVRPAALQNTRPCITFGSSSYVRDLEEGRQSDA
jgi:hypothetical protein